MVLLSYGHTYSMCQGIRKWKLGFDPNILVLTRERKEIRLHEPIKRKQRTKKK